MAKVFRRLQFSALYQCIRKLYGMRQLLASNLKKIAMKKNILQRFFQNFTSENVSHTKKFKNKHKEGIQTTWTRLFWVAFIQTLNRGERAKGETGTS